MEATTDEQKKIERAKLDTLKIEAAAIEQDIASRETTPREYAFAFDRTQPLERQYNDFIQDIDMDSEGDLAKLEKLNLSEKGEFLDRMVKTIKALEQGDAVDFAQQDKDYDYLHQSAKEWQLHKDAQRYEANERYTLRADFVTRSMIDFGDSQAERHSARLDSFNDQEARNREKLDKAYEAAQRRLPLDREQLEATTQRLTETTQEIAAAKPQIDPALIAFAQAKLESTRRPGHDLDFNP